MLLLLASGYYVKQGKALYKSYPVAAFNSMYRKFLSALQVSGVETVANLAATAKLATYNWACELQFFRGGETAELRRPFTRINSEMFTWLQGLPLAQRMEALILFKFHNF